MCDWEFVTEDHPTLTQRMKVPGGWLVRTMVMPFDKNEWNIAQPFLARGSVAIVFVPDANHDWAI